MSNQNVLVSLRRGVRSELFEVAALLPNGTNGTNGTNATNVRDGKNSRYG